MLGDGNIGNDAQLESMLAYIRGTYPNAVVDAMCAGPEIMRRTYGIGAVPMHWQQQFETGAHGRRSHRNKHAIGPDRVLRNCGASLRISETAGRMNC